METTSPDMPSDVVINILSRLPVKSLIRFRCVCKSWHDLIGDPNFIDIHLKFNQTVAYDKGYMVFNQPVRRFLKNNKGQTFDFTSVSFQVEGYCNGLLCIAHPGCSSVRDIYLLNPAVHKFKALPKSALFGGVEVIAYMFVIFGFFPLINDYRVIKIVKGNGFDYKGPPKVEIYSLRLNSWKEIQNIVPFSVISDKTIDPIVNGVVHCVASREDIGEHKYAEFILTFDMANEVFGELKLPEFCLNENVGCKSVIRLKESLSLFVQYQEGENTQVDIWVMKEYGAAESWTKQFTFDGWVSGYPIGYLKNGEVVLRRGSDRLVSYDPNVNQVKDLQVPGVTMPLDAYIYYVESLFLLNETLILLNERN